MNILNYKKTLYRNIVNIPGWRTHRKIVVIESDDWGSIRMPSREVYVNLLKKGIRVDNLSYTRYDSLASEEDLSMLFEVLLSVRDKNGNPAVITANTIVGNPDFEKIRESDFQEYFYEPFTDTLKRYPQHAQSFQLWQKGRQYGIFQPQFHGREHLNVSRWMRILKKDKGNVRLAFDYGMFDISENDQISENSFMDAFNFEDEEETVFQKKAIEEGLKLFKSLFGYNSRTFIAPCYIWSSKLNKTLLNNGVTILQGGWYQLEPQPGIENKFKKKFHYTGDQNKLGQIFLTRNASFEPSQLPEFDYVNDVISRMKMAFQWGKPVIIGAHRLNFIGFIDPSNRERNLTLFAHLLKSILKKWPDIEFMSSDQLGGLIFKKK